MVNFSPFLTTGTPPFTRTLESPSSHPLTSRFYVVFEMMRGGALIDHIESLKTFTEKQASIVVKGVASALKHLHGQGIIVCGVNVESVTSALQFPR